MASLCRPHLYAAAPVASGEHKRVCAVCLQQKKAKNRGERVLQLTEMLYSQQDIEMLDCSNPPTSRSTSVGGEYQRICHFQAEAIAKRQIYGLPAQQGLLLLFGVQKMVHFALIKPGCTRNTIPFGNCDLNTRPVTSRTDPDLVGVERYRDTCTELIRVANGGQSRNPPGLGVRVARDLHLIREDVRFVPIYDLALKSQPVPSA